MKKILIIGLTLIMCTGMLVGCGSSHGIPNGRYIACNEEGKIMGATDVYWQIRGNNANHYLSGLLVYKCTIVQEENKIYFVFDGIDNISAFKEEARYDKSTGILTFHSLRYIKKSIS